MKKFLLSLAVLAALTPLASACSFVSHAYHRSFYVTPVAFVVPTVTVVAPTVAVSAPAVAVEAPVATVAVTPVLVATQVVYENYFTSFVNRHFVGRERFVINRNRFEGRRVTRRGR